MCRGIQVQSTWYFPGSELLRVVEKLVQDQQELKLERQGEAKCRQPNHHTNGHSTDIDTPEGCFQRDEMMGFSFRKLSLMTE